jgi:ParB family chromosome partitioning protein
VFHADYPLAALRPAPYNPRKIDEPAFLALQHSIKTLGMVKPIIAGEDGTIVAGHQRSRAAMAVGVTHAPVYIVKDLNKLDEIRFNQLHNGTDLDTGDENVRVPPCATVGYVDVPHVNVKCNL